MNRARFETWVETQLAPELEPGDVVILDNVAFHKSQRAAELVRQRGAWLLPLPPYSPDLNPIEMAFSKLKALLRKRAARSFDAIWGRNKICFPRHAKPEQSMNVMRREGGALAA